MIPPAHFAAMSAQVVAGGVLAASAIPLALATDAGPLWAAVVVFVLGKVGDLAIKGYREYREIKDQSLAGQLEEAERRCVGHIGDLERSRKELEHARADIKFGQEQCGLLQVRITELNTELVQVRGINAKLNQEIAVIRADKHRIADEAAAAIMKLSAIEDDVAQRDE